MIAGTIRQPDITIRGFVYVDHHDFQRIPYSKGKKIAEKVARELGYECVSRDILLEASEQFNTPEIKLVRALHDAPSVLHRFTHGKERFVAYIQDALLTHFKRDNVV